MAVKSDLMVITKAKDLCSYVMTVTQKSPKQFRFSLVARLQGYAPDMIANLYRAKRVFLFGLDAEAKARQRLDNYKLLGAWMNSDKKRLQP